MLKIRIISGNNKIHLSFQHGYHLHDTKGHSLIGTLRLDNEQEPSVVNQSPTQTPVESFNFPNLHLSLSKEAKLPSLAPGLFARFNPHQSETSRLEQNTRTPNTLNPQNQAAPRGPAPRNRRGIFECNYCGKVFPTWTGRYYHMPIHTGKWKHTCLICDKHFMRTDRYEQHIEKHRLEHKTAGNIHKI